MRSLRRPAVARSKASDEGFTLVEMLVAISLITIAVLALLSGFLTVGVSAQKQQLRSEGVRAALDVNESLRLLGYDDPGLTIGTHTGTKTAPDGSTYTYATVITERDADPAAVTPGDIVKDIRTTVSWSGRHTGNVSYTTAMARDAKDLGAPSGYLQSIRSMSVAPDPSVVVTYEGYTNDPIIVTVVLTGHDVSDVVHISYTDDNGTHTTDATSTDGRYWRLTLPAGSAGLKRVLARGAQVDQTFTGRTDTGLTSTTTLKVFGPVDNPPAITSFTVSPNPLDMINGGGSRYQNKGAVTFSCVVNGLSPAVSNDSVRATYIGETGETVQINLTRQAGASLTASTWTYVFPSSTTFFGIGNNQPYTCVVKRYLDGGPASKLISVQVKK